MKVIPDIGDLINAENALGRRLAIWLGQGPGIDGLPRRNVYYFMCIATGELIRTLADDIYEIVSSVEKDD